MTTRNIGITALIIVLLGVAFYFLAYKPLDEQQVAVEAQTAQLNTQADQLRNQLSQLQMIRDNELEIRADLNRLRSLIPADDPAQPSFVRALQLAGDASGVNILSVTFAEPAVLEGGPAADDTGRVLTEVTLNTVVEGGYFQLVDLFRRLEVEVVRGVNIDDITITEGTDGFPTLQATVTGRIFSVLPLVPDPAPEPVPTEEGGAAATVEGAVTPPDPEATEGAAQ